MVRPLAFAAVLFAGLPSGTAAQSLAELLTAVRQGGGWLSVPIADGRGSLEAGPLVTAGVDVSGCFQVWNGHSGLWKVLARDERGDGRVEAQVRPGEPVRFEYAPGPTAHIVVDVEWSQPRDTTLLLWVGLDRKLMARERDACEPVYAGVGGRGP